MWDLEICLQTQLIVGSCKDTWIVRHRQAKPTISLDYQIFIILTLNVQARVIFFPLCLG